VLDNSIQLNLARNY